MQVVRSIKGVAVPVSGSSCANLFWIDEKEDGAEATALQELAGRLEPWYLIGQNTVALEEQLKGATPPFHSQLYIIHRKADLWEVWEVYGVGGERVRALIATWWPANLTSSLLGGERWAISL